MESAINLGNTNTTVETNSKTKIPFSVKNIATKVKNDFKLANEIAKLKKQWNDVMVNCKLYNEERDSYELFNLEKQEYGWSGLIDRPAGMTVKKILECKDEIEEYIPCIFQMKYEMLKKYAKVDIITESPANIIFNPDFTKVQGFMRKLNSWETYLGNAFTGEPIVRNMTEQPHILGTGITGSGKSQLLNIILTTLIYNCSPDDLSLYLVQLDKGDLTAFEDCEQVKYFGYTLEEAYAVVRYLYDIITYRNKLLKQYIKSFKASNFLEYNALKGVKPFSSVYLVIDEFSSLASRNDGNADAKKLRLSITFWLEEVIRLGRSVGINVIVATQRPTAEMISPFLKSQINNIITFKQINEISSRVCIDTDDAVNLKKRQAIIKSFDIEYMHTPTITPALMKTYLTPSIKPNKPKQTLPVEQLINEFYEGTKESKGKKSNGNNNQNKQPKKDKKNNVSNTAPSNSVDLAKLIQDFIATQSNKPVPTPLPEFDKVPRITTEVVEENCKKNIPNYVDYKPNVKVLSEEEYRKRQQNQGGDNK